MLNDASNPLQAGQSLIIPLLKTNIYCIVLIGFFCYLNAFPWRLDKDLPPNTVNIEEESIHVTTNPGITMGRVSLENLKPGMVLAGNAEANGQTLLAKGSEISDKHIKTFKAWGLDDVEIEGLSEAGLTAEVIDQIDPQVYASIEAILKKRFALCDMNHPAISTLFNLCVLREINSN